MEMKGNEEKEIKQKGMKSKDGKEKKKKMN